MNPAAYFPQAQRIAFDPGNGQPVILLDTQNHQIGGFSQQQSGPGDPFVGITFSSQFALSSLARVRPAGTPVQDTAPPAVPEPEAMPEPAKTEPPPASATPVAPEPMPAPAPAKAAPAQTSATDILNVIERLAALRDSGALTDEDYTKKKVELLARL